jgi:uncharacterized protein (TIGR02001 family)
MKFKSKFLLALLATSSAAFAQTAPETTLGYNVGVASEYRYRGIAQTKGDAALQGGVDYANANGFYAGAWGSSIKWIKDSGSNASGPVELDLYGGYKFEAAGVAYDVGYLRYEYVNNSYNKVSGVNANTDEVYGAATYGVVTAKYSYAFSDLFGTANSKGSTYWDLSANFDLGNGYTLTPHAGRQVIKNSPNSYTDIALTLGKDLGDGLSASISAISTNAKNNTYYTSTATNYNTAKEAVVVGVKYSF